MRHIFTIVVLLLCASQGAIGQETATYNGTWRTTNRKLDGNMNCIVTPAGHEKWKGRFYGVWQGVAFDYVVTFAGPPSKLEGTATIDGAHYSWTGEMSKEPPRSFKGTFGGSRYTGYFDLREREPGDRAKVEKPN